MISYHFYALLSRKYKCTRQFLVAHFVSLRTNTFTFRMNDTVVKHIVPFDTWYRTLYGTRYGTLDERTVYFLKRTLCKEMARYCTIRSYESVSYLTLKISYELEPPFHVLRCNLIFFRWNTCLQ